MHPVDSVQNAYMRGARHDRQLRGWERSNVADDSAAEQAEHLDGVFGPHEIRISDNEQRWRSDALDVLCRPGPDRAVQLPDLGDEGWPGVRIGRHGHVGAVPYGVVEIVRC